MSDYSDQPHGASTTWTWRKAKIRRPAGGQTTRVAEGDASGSAGQRRIARRWSHLPRWDRRRKLTLVLRYRGGAEGWIEVAGRGSFGRFHGSTAILDVWAEVVDGMHYAGYQPPGTSSVVEEH